MVLSIDFDQTIHDTKTIPPGKRMGLPIDGAREALLKLKEDGHILIISSVRASGGVHHMVEWFRYFDIPFDEITDKKVKADLYIDNLGLHFITWEQTLLEIDNR